MKSLTVSIIRTRVSNTASVSAAFTRLGYASCHIDDAAGVASADYVVLPGVGSFAAGMDALHSQNLVESLQQRINIGHPTLAICLGMQMLCDSSQESPGVKGLGVLGCEARRLRKPELRVPHLGWNTVKAGTCSNYISSGHAYFANSYCIENPPPGWCSAMTLYGTKFVAAIERGSVLACQFHPELSGQYGADLLKRWLTMGQEIEPCSRAV